MNEKFSVAFVGRIKNGAIYEFLKQKGWSQAEFARRLGVRMTDVSNWMLLKKVPHKEETLKKIEHLMGRLREDIFPELLQTKEWQEFIEQAPREYAVIREISVKALMARQNPLALPSVEDEYLEEEEAAESLRALQDALDILTPKERMIIEMHTGLGDTEQLTLVQIGDALGISAERTRQIERSAFRKLRWNLNKK